MKIQFLYVAIAPLLLALPARAEQEAPPPAAMEPAAVSEDRLPSKRLNGALDVLESVGFDVTGETAYRTMLEALIRHFDPDAGIISDDGDDARERRRAGRVYQADVPLEWSTNQLVLAQASTGDEELEAYTDLVNGPRTVVLKLGGHDTERLGWFHARRLLRADTPDPLILVTRQGDQQVVTQRVDRVETTLPALEQPEAFPFQLGYLQIHRLREQSGAEIAAHVRAWAEDNFQGMVLDLRGADGADLDSVRAVAGLFAQQGEHLFAYRDQDDQDLYIAQAEHAHAVGLPVMVLVDAETGGAAEVLAAVLSDSVRGAMLFGQPTRGDFLLRETLTLPDGLSLRLATRRLVTGNGTTYTGHHGVRPDVLSQRDETPVPTNPVRSRRTEILDEERDQLALHQRTRGDDTLRRAVDVLLGLRALDIRPRMAQ